jgi:hypothetical protein
MPIWRSILRRCGLTRDSMPPSPIAASVADLAQPGIYWSPDEIEVDLMVPETMGGAGRRGARLGPHGNRSARKARGLEAALVDNSTIALEALDPGDDRIIEAPVAGVAALVVAKAHKLGERLRRAPDRLGPKDALDVLRLLRSSEGDALAATFQALLADERARVVTMEALAYVRELFATPEAAGLDLVGDAVAGLDDPAIVRASMRALTNQLLNGVK